MSKNFYDRHHDEIHGLTKDEDKDDRNLAEMLDVDSIIPKNISKMPSREDNEESDLGDMSPIRAMMGQVSRANSEKSPSKGGDSIHPNSIEPSRQNSKLTNKSKLSKHDSRSNHSSKSHPSRSNHSSKSYANISDNKYSQGWHKFRDRTKDMIENALHIKFSEVLAIAKINREEDAIKYVEASEVTNFIDMILSEYQHFCDTCGDFDESEGTNKKIAVVQEMYQKTTDMCKKVSSQLTYRDEKYQQFRYDHVRQNNAITEKVRELRLEYKKELIPDTVLNLERIQYEEDKNVVALAQNMLLVKHSDMVQDNLSLAYELKNLHQVIQIELSRVTGYVNELVRFFDDQYEDFDEDDDDALVGVTQQRLIDFKKNAKTLHTKLTDISKKKIKSKIQTKNSGVQVCLDGSSIYSKPDSPRSIRRNTEPVSPKSIFFVDDDDPDSEKIGGASPEISSAFQGRFLMPHEESGNKGVPLTDEELEYKVEEMLMEKYGDIIQQIRDHEEGGESKNSMNAEVKYARNCTRKLFISIETLFKQLQCLDSPSDFSVLCGPIYNPQDDLHVASDEMMDMCSKISDVKQMLIRRDNEPAKPVALLCPICDERKSKIRGGRLKGQQPLPETIEEIGLQMESELKKKIRELDDTLGSANIEALLPNQKVSVTKTVTVETFSDQCDNSIPSAPKGQYFANRQAALLGRLHDRTHTEPPRTVKKNQTLSRSTISVTAISPSANVTYHGDQKSTKIFDSQTSRTLTLPQVKSISGPQVKSGSGPGALAKSPTALQVKSAAPPTLKSTASFPHNSPVPLDTDLDEISNNYGNIQDFVIHAMQSLPQIDAFKAHTAAFQDFASDCSNDAILPSRSIVKSSSDSNNNNSITLDSAHTQQEKASSSSGGKNSNEGIIVREYAHDNRKECDVNVVGHFNVPIVPVHVVEPLSRAACLIKIQEGVRNIMNYEDNLLGNIVNFRQMVIAAMNFTDGPVRDVVSSINNHLLKVEKIVINLGSDALNDPKLREGVVSMQAAANSLTSVKLWRNKGGGWFGMPKGVKQGKKCIARTGVDCISVHNDAQHVYKEEQENTEKIIDPQFSNLPPHKRPRPTPAMNEFRKKLLLWNKNISDVAAQYDGFRKRALNREKANPSEAPHLTVYKNDSIPNNNFLPVLEQVGGPVGFESHLMM